MRSGAIRLCLTVAQQRDRANRALAWIKDGSPQPDSRKELYDKRITCYSEIWKVIEAVDASTTNVMRGELDTSQVGRRKEEAYTVIDGSDDEVFQNCLFDWYLQRNWSQRLLDLTSPYVVSYLQRKSENEQDVADLLWRYYAHHRQYFEAAKVQLQLAKSGFPIDLATRIEYLSRAKANASARTLGFGDMSGAKQAVMSDISDQLDCATVQLDTLRRLEQDPRMRPENKTKVEEQLNSRILSLDEVRCLQDIDIMEAF
jgi:nuclear pore complex protein Nup155